MLTVFGCIIEGKCHAMSGANMVTGVFCPVVLKIVLRVTGLLIFGTTEELYNITQCCQIDVIKCVFETS